MLTNMLTQPSKCWSDYYRHRTRVAYVAQQLSLWQSPQPPLVPSDFAGCSHKSQPEVMWHWLHHGGRKVVCTYKQIDRSNWQTKQGGLVCTAAIHSESVEETGQYKVDKQLGSTKLINNW